jgi:NadR type nicotinamide-nucleotide adenylyltransferase
MELKKIVIIGPESTGKSSLCEQLARHFKTVWVPEYAREFIAANNNQYACSDLLTIAKGQIANEERIVPQAKNGYVFIDTDMYVMKVWDEFVCNKCEPYILEQLAQRKYDYYLLCDVDLPWTADEMWEYPDLATRDKLFHIRPIWKTNLHLGRL